jgi:5-methylcytosine-specific restriction endonuclease McrA
MAKKRRKTPLTKTLYSRISSTLRRVWQWSPERKARIKLANGACEHCGLEVKGYDACVHHVRPADFRRIERVVREELLCEVDNLLLLCRDCHHEVHHPKGEKS